MSDTEAGAERHEHGADGSVERPSSRGAHDLAPALDRLAREHPELRVELVEEEAEESLPLLLRGRLDVVIAEEYEHAPRERLPELHRSYLEPDEMVIALPSDHAAAVECRPDRAGVARRLHLGHGARRTAYADMCARLCRSVGGFEPDIRTVPTTCSSCSSWSPALRRVRAGVRPAAAASARRGAARRRGQLQPGDLRGRPRERPLAAVDGRGRRRGQPLAHLRGSSPRAIASATSRGRCTQSAAALTSASPAA